MIGKILRYMRQSKKMTQKELADKLSVAQTTLSGWESGYREPTFEIIEKIANICEFNISFQNNNSQEIINTKNINRKI